MSATDEEDTSDTEESEDDRVRSPSPDVKSTAVVKYTAVKCPIGFAKLQRNTDLKMPPSNWLSSATDSYGLRHALSQSTGFSSFRMAHMFPDCVGEVDVVSGAECIKNLLKLPYHPNSVVSMMVHRVENTLLLDDFDIYQYLMKSEWSWMKKFFYENFFKFISMEDRVTYMKNKSRYALQQKRLVSKFLYYSLPSSKMGEISSEENKELRLPTLPLSGPILPEPDVKKTVPYPNFTSHTYNRNVVWTFENIQMLIGSDMPIFGGNDRPCVSLRLRDATEPINVLTGIDYWLDNLMCNVPEVIMCYHLDGIVRKYEPIKTEDLPNLKDSKFSPKVIRNVAQNILSFLKSNATKAGHTYWLFKGTHDDVVKLYDLSTLCGSTGSSSDQNPFTIPVAMLLYRVARNMKTPCQSGHIKMLLENCIKLLPVEKYPHIIASSYFMLANLYVPEYTNPGSPNFKELTPDECECGNPMTCRRQEGYDDEPPPNAHSKRHSSEDVFANYNFNKMENCKSNKDSRDSESNKKSNKIHKEHLISGDVAVHSLTAPTNPLITQLPSPPMVSGKLEDRCLQALQHVENGLSVLKYYLGLSKKNENQDTAQDFCSNEDNPKMAKPYESIPMTYEPINQKEDKCKMAQPHIPIPMHYKNEIIDPESEQESVLIENSNSERLSRRRKKEGKTRKKTSSESQAVTKDEMKNIRQKIDEIILRKDTAIPTWQEPSDSDNLSWKIHLKILLYEKACLACATLAEQYFTDSQYGLSLKYIIMTQKCKIILNLILSKSGGVDECCLLRRTGDNLFQFAKNWNKYEKEYLNQINILSKNEEFIMKEIYCDLDMYKNDKNAINYKSIIDFKPPENLEKTLLISCEYFNKALKIAPKDHKEELLRRIASVKNELGLKYMYDAQEQYAIYCNKSDNNGLDSNKKELPFEILSKKSFVYLTESARIFEQVNDIPNLALLHCNTGRFMRFRAHCNQIIHSPEQRKLYASAIDHYGCAMRLLIGEDCGNMLDLVRWELSSALFTQASLLQDSPPNSPNAANEAAEALKLALRNCPLVEGPRQCLYQFRAGVLHHRLGSLYHNQFRDPNVDPSKQKAAAALSKLNYEQAIKLFLPLEDTSMFLTVQLEHIALTEYQANNSPGLKLKFLQSALELLLQCEPILKIISERDSVNLQKLSPQKENGSLNINNPLDSPTGKKPNGTNNNGMSDDDVENEYKLLTLYQQRLQYILKTLIQINLQKSSGKKKENDETILCYKSAYSLTLKTVKFSFTECKSFAWCLYEIITEIKKTIKIET